MKCLSIAVLALFLATPAMATSNQPPSRTVSVTTTVSRVHTPTTKTESGACQKVVHVNSQGVPFVFSKKINFITCRVAGSGPQALTTFHTATGTRVISTPKDCVHTYKSARK